MAYTDILYEKKNGVTWNTINRTDTRNDFQTKTVEELTDAFVDARWDRTIGVVVLIALLREDARWAMPPAPLWFDGRAAIARMFELFPIGWQGRDFRVVPTAANRQPAAACYLRLHGESAYRLAALHVLRIEDGQIAEVTTFGPELCHAFGLPPTL